MMPGSKSTPDDQKEHLPKRGGRYRMEECSLGFQCGFPKIFDHPELGALKIDRLEFEYIIDDGQTEPDRRDCISKIYWFSIDNGFYEEIPIGIIHFAATDALEEPERWAKFIAYAEENSVEIPRKTIADYVRESQRRQAA